jgi:hypothetical protein
MTPTCIAFEIQENNKIKILKIGIPFATLGSATEYFRENLRAQVSSLSDIKPPCKEISPENVVIKDVSHLTPKNQQLLNSIKTLAELETFLQKTERNPNLDFTNPEFKDRMNEIMSILQKNGNITVQEIYSNIDFKRTSQRTSKT